MRQAKGRRGRKVGDMLRADEVLWAFSQIEGCLSDQIRHSKPINGIEQLNTSPPMFTILPFEKETVCVL